MAADDIEGFQYFRPHIEWPEIKLTSEQCRAVRSVLMGESPEEYARKEDFRKFMGFDGPGDPPKVTAEVMELRVAQYLNEEKDRRIGHGPHREFCSRGCCGPGQVWQWKCPHCPFETDSLTEGQGHVKQWWIDGGCKG